MCSLESFPPRDVSLAGVSYDDDVAFFPPLSFVLPCILFPLFHSCIRFLFPSHSAAMDDHSHAVPLPTFGQPEPTSLNLPQEVIHPTWAQAHTMPNRSFSSGSSESLFNMQEARMPFNHGRFGHVTDSRDASPVPSTTSSLRADSRYGAMHSRDSGSSDSPFNMQEARMPFNHGRFGHVTDSRDASPVPSTTSSLRADSRYGAMHSRDISPYPSPIDPHEQFQFLRETNAALQRRVEDLAIENGRLAAYE